VPNVLENGKINFHKYNVESKIYKKVHLYRSADYNLKLVQPFQHFLQNISALDEGELYKHALSCEPKLKTV
jgi:hypothetical protein